MNNPTEKEQPMIHNEPDSKDTKNNKQTTKPKLLKNLLRPLTGLPNHGTRWARAKNPTLRVLNIEERTALQ